MIGKVIVQNLVGECDVLDAPHRFADLELSHFVDQEVTHIRTNPHHVLRGAWWGSFIGPIRLIGPIRPISRMTPTNCRTKHGGDWLVILDAFTSISSA